MKIYEKPMLFIEEFTVNHTIADCGETTSEVTGDYECLTGDVKDSGAAWSSQCARPCKEFPGYKRAVKLGGNSASFTNCDGIIAYCVQGSTYVGTSEWYESKSDKTVYHKNSHPKSQTYHCMVRGYKNSEIGDSLS